MGVRPTDVDDIFLPHVHADHVGWNTVPAHTERGDDGYAWAFA